ncbi:Rid family detoxifying hydrolase [Natrialba asiatica]|uniref:Endoribonuclease L-PSP n=1 Tax=Natrialba asiatica (strain ATCC 700177 / DSM 12278 / JCM 9576 / FERM P-10747 / NBRC 102637 / 172P1) TaxID=29540 RepID=M0B3M8_NATA1|nr:Rid family detoxifying hydrolase [Natrialba asiatica]ELZ05405.1 endoribonuclease L-PSP [Natrialba asiatica DSM 12278]
MKEVSTTSAPASIGPFSQGLIEDGTVYVSGQGPIDPESDDIVGESIEAQTRRTMENIDAVLTAANSSLDDIVKSTVFVRDMDDYEAINDVYETYLTDPYPARSAVEVAALPVDIGVEIEVVARVSR